MNRANADIRNAVATNGFKLWELAAALGISYQSFSTGTNCIFGIFPRYGGSMGKIQQARQ